MRPEVENHYSNSQPYAASDYDNMRSNSYASAGPTPYANNQHAYDSAFNVVNNTTYTSANTGYPSMSF